ncbi:MULTISPECIES: threonine synthase [unclassified Enterococcus]|uniref:threonine synthase n=1 Tax=unclassified Enterococcus TaxID=2608891 RepID=UPI001553A122|nr:MULTISPECIES: threonine synthase [unclassified Enterococcus]MBS7577236.1 threonine synthase [Enterococcus sp. MMGLQ5-2]MBS7584671.1 threonine synthase [Enterococcus sp. MMGLQ5-1]NPD12526.1 threonine synthase [Enterococcus sp. MMGLQ5-1]NPD37070.1 threonine synthase [Enterococcus sp. MMGLQ5-2]
MTLYFQSTRNKNNKVTASQAVLQGLAVDGGLYVPSELPKFNLNFNELSKLSYQELALQILQPFFDDYTSDELAFCVNSAYDHKFDTPEIAPLKQVGNEFFLELFHGSTIAFKDMALSILPYLMTTAAKKNQVENEIVILTATSGDTGKAAMAGFADVPGTSIIVFYPKDGVSQIQERQMVTQKGDNTHVVAIDGNFDAAQTNVKKMFNNQALREKLLANGKQFSSANSMNIGRLFPQVVYYVYAYAKLIKNGAIKAGDAINFSVPTGNFGNILAAYYAKAIGLPINKLICASNENHVLTDFFNSGAYDKNRDFFVTTSPSMDILVSSNLERLIFHLTGNDDQATAQFMSELETKGEYLITEEMQGQLKDFFASYATEAQTAAQIAQTFKNENYIEDPHTAVAEAVYQKYLAKTGDQTPSVIVSTASAYKFPRVVVEAINGPAEVDDFELVKILNQISDIEIPLAVKDLFAAKIRHQTVVAEDEMQAIVTSILKIK